MKKKLLFVVTYLILFSVGIAVGTQFSDVSPGDWYYNDVSTLAELNILRGNPDGTFAPEQSLNRAEAAAINNRLINYIRTRDLLYSFHEWLRVNQPGKELHINGVPVIGHFAGESYRTGILKSGFLYVYGKIEALPLDDELFDSLNMCLYSLHQSNNSFVIQDCSIIGELTFI